MNNKFNKILFTLIAVFVFLFPGLSKGQTNQRDLEWSVQNPPRPVFVLRKKRLVYELYLTNGGNQPLVLEQLDIYNGRDELVVSLSKHQLKKSLQMVDFFTGATQNPKNSARPIVPAGEQVVIYLEINVKKDEVPEYLKHSLRYQPQNKGNRSVIIEGTNVAIKNETPPILGAPLSGGPWIAIYSSEWKRGHRRFIYAQEGRPFIPGRFTIDFMKLNEEGMLFHGERDRIANWYGYGADVLAAADAVVFRVHGGVAESPTISGHINPPAEKAAGNYIILKLKNGQFVFYEHLKPGSILVEKGDYVKKGQVIAALGYTGQTTGPHLHFHVADRPSSLYAEGLPFVFEQFKLLGLYKDLGQLGNPWIALSDSISKRRYRERSPSNSVLGFEKKDIIKR